MTALWHSRQCPKSSKLTISKFNSLRHARQILLYPLKKLIEKSNFLRFNNIKECDTTRVYRSNTIVVDLLEAKPYWYKWNNGIFTKNSHNKIYILFKQQKTQFNNFKIANRSYQFIS